MCLYIDERFHGKFFGNPTPAAETLIDVLCFKGLERSYSDSNRNSWVSPYQGMMYQFGKLYKSELYQNEMGDIDEGLHSYRSERHGKEFDFGGTDYGLFPAIIPKGSKIFVSSRGHGEYASGRLIVFKDMAMLEAVYGKVAPAVKQVEALQRLK